MYPAGLMILVRPFLVTHWGRTYVYLGMLELCAHAAAFLYPLTAVVLIYGYLFPYKCVW